MEYRLLNSFMVVAEMLHFGRAAKFLNLTQPALSAQIAALERELGGELFMRGARGITLTEAGRILLKDAKKLLKQSDNLCNKIRNIFNGNEGIIRIGYGDVTELKRLSRPLLLLKERHPAVELEVNELYPGETMESVQSGLLDAAVITGTDFMEFPSGLTGFPIMTGPIRLAMHSHNPLASRKNIRREHLLGEQFIKRKFGETDETSDFRKLLEEWWKNYFAGEEKVLLTVRRRSTAFWLVSSGIGLAFLPNCMELISLAPKEYTFFTNVKFFELPELNISSYTWFVHRENKTPALDNFIKSIADCLDLPAARQAT